MAGTVLTAGVVACTAVFAAGLVTAGAGTVFGQRLAGVADAAALAAADAASGAVTGTPCERAAQVAAIGGASIARCDLDDLVATIVVTAPFGRLTATAAARAGPAP